MPEISGRRCGPNTKPMLQSIDHANQLYWPQHDFSYPKSHDEFMKDVVALALNGIPLPEIPEDEEYIYVPEQPEVGLQIRLIPGSPALEDSCGRAWKGARLRSAGVGCRWGHHTSTRGITVGSVARSADPGPAAPRPRASGGPIRTQPADQPRTGRRKSCRPTFASAPASSASRATRTWKSTASPPAGFWRPVRRRSARVSFDNGPCREFATSSRRGRP